MGDRFVARNSRPRLLLLLLAAIVFVALGLRIAGLFGPPPKPGREWLGWLGAVFFGFAGIVGVRRLFDTSDQLVIDRNGIFWRHWSEMTIPWSAIESFSTHSIRRQQFLSLHLRNPAMFPRSGPGGWIGGFNRSLGFGDIALTVAGTDRSFDELVAAIDRHAPER